MRKFIFVIVALIGITASAKVRLPQFFSDNMVLQQESECNIWGWVEPGTRVSITTSWDKKCHNVQANKDGRFGVTVKTPKAGGPYFIGFKDKDYVQISNVMIGEVWICSGQSNMEMLMKGYKAQPVEGATEELFSCQDNELRLFYAKRLASLEPQQDLEGSWQEANAASVREFSATAYYFGKALRKALGVPVGLICTAFGGSACEAWMNADWLKAFPKVNQHVTEADVKKLQQRCPTALYNGQLKPLIYDGAHYGIRGAIWYQGEDNVPRYDYYAPLMARMIQGWREDWHQGDFPFYYCQIAPFAYDETDWALYNSAFLREQQEKVESIVPNCRMAVLMDTPSKITGFVVTSRLSFKSCRRVVKSTASMSGLPLLVESVSELAHIPSNSRTQPSCSTFVFSIISPVSPLWLSRIRTTGFAVINRRNDFIRASGVVPNLANSSAKPDDEIPLVYGISITSPPCSFITWNTSSRMYLSGPSTQSSP